jgi:hypothetical protein
MMSNAGRIAGAAMSVLGVGASVYATKDFIFQDLSADITGTWVFDLTVDDSTLAAMKGVKLRYFINVQQDGLKLVGEGEKVCENGAPIDAQHRTRLELIGGKVEGAAVSMAFRDHGKLRQTTGTFELSADSSDAMTGKFVWTAANTTGKLAAKRAATTRCD